jgi:hypothetical protein
MGLCVRVFITSVFILFCGCAPDPPRRPEVVSYLDVTQKQQYIQNAMSTLKIFHEAAIDLRSRRKPMARKELAEEVDHYIDVQVKPIIGDFEANHNLKTRLQVAELQLLSGLVYLELKEYDEALALLNTMKRRYSDSPELLSAAIDRKYIGFRNLEDGMRVLNERLWREFLTFSPPPSS